MNTGDLLSESEWQMMLQRDPDADQSAWEYGSNVIDEFFAPNAPFWVETNNNGELIASVFQSQFNGQAGSGSGMDTGGGSASGMQQIDNGINFLPTLSSSEVLDAVVSTNQQSSPPASLDPALMSPSVVVSDTELSAADEAEISKMSNSLPPSVFGGEHDPDVAMEDSPPLPFVRATSPLVVGREGAQTLQYGTGGTAGRTPHGAQQPLQQVHATSSNTPAQTLRATPNMADTAALSSSSPYHRGRHTQSTNGAESLRRDMEQHAKVLPATTAAIPFPGLKTQNTLSPAQETTKEEEPASTPAKVTKKCAYTRRAKITMTETTTSPAQETAEEDESIIALARLPKKRAYTRKPKLATETTTTAQETAEDDESTITLAKATTLAKVIKKRAYTRKSGTTAKATASSAQETAEANEPASTPAKVIKTRKPKAAIENQMFAVTTTSNNGTKTEKLAKGSELGFKSPAPKAAKAPKRETQPMRQEISGGAEANKRAKVKNGCSSREVRLLTGVEVKEDNRRKTRASVKAGGETEDGPDAGKAVRQRRQAKK